MVKGWLRDKGHFYYLEDGKMLFNTTISLDGRSFSFDEHGVCTSDTSNLNFTEGNVQNNSNNSNNSNNNNNSQGPGVTGPGANVPGGSSSGTNVNPNGNQPSSGDGPNSQGPSGNSGSAGNAVIQEGSTNGPN
jgi:hypothetical protein